MQVWDLVHAEGAAADRVPRGGQRCAVDRQFREQEPRGQGLAGFWDPSLPPEPHRKNRFGDYGVQSLNGPVPKLKPQRRPGLVGWGGTKGQRVLPRQHSMGSPSLCPQQDSAVLLHPCPALPSLEAKINLGGQGLGDLSKAKAPQALCVCLIPRGTRGGTCRPESC